MHLQPDLILEQRDPKMKPIFWILTFECLTIVLLIALALSGFPTYLALKYKGGAYFYFVFTALGLWLTWISIRLLHRYVWDNNHLNHYKLHQDRIEYIQYDKKKRESFEDTIYLGEIEQIVIGRYYALYYYAYKKFSLTEHHSLAHILPCLHIVYSKNGKRNVVEIPIYEQNDMDIWLNKLSELGTPYRVFVNLLTNMNKEQRLEALANHDYSFPYSNNTPFRQACQQLDIQMNQHVQELVQRKSSSANDSTIQTTSSSSERGSSL
jgi:hypothetical protein